MSRHPTAQAGKRLGRYRIERELGRGGMGVVYVAVDENTGRQVALKTTSVAQLAGGSDRLRSQRRERFVREVRALAQVNHRNVVHVFDAGEADDPDLGWFLYYTMEVVEGVTLSQLVQQQGPLDAAAAAAVVGQVASGLGEAHLHGIVHRDVKPANIFINTDGRALIGDFGICKIEGSSQITRRDQLVGTPNYLAPEQILGDPVSPATDVFALGALFFVVTMNRPLRRQVDGAALLQSAAGDEPMQRMLTATAIPGALRQVMAKCLERDPARRYSEGHELAEALADLAGAVPRVRGLAPTRVFAEETQDALSAFQSLPSSEFHSAEGPAESNPNNADVVAQEPDSEASAVEAAARTMLGEVERRAGSRPAAQAAPAFDFLELPVAEAESTLMFNLKAALNVEAERRPAAATAARTAPVAAIDNGDALPVAFAESTRMYQLQQHAFGGETPEAYSAAEPAVAGRPGSDPFAEPFAEPSADVSLQPPSMQDRGQTDPPAEAPALPEVDGTPPIDIEAPQHPARHWISAVAVGAAAALLLGAIAAVFLVPGDALTGVPSQPQDVPLPAVRTGLCPARTVDETKRAQAAFLYDEAREEKRQGTRDSAVIEKLEQSIALDPGNPLAFYDLGKVSRGRRQSEAFECVCAIAPSSKECAAIRRVQSAD